MFKQCSGNVFRFKETVFKVCFLPRVPVQLYVVVFSSLRFLWEGTNTPPKIMVSRCLIRCVHRVFIVGQVMLFNIRACISNSFVLSPNSLLKCYTYFATIIGHLIQCRKRWRFIRTLFGNNPPYKMVGVFHVAPRWSAISLVQSQVRSWARPSTICGVLDLWAEKNNYGTISLA